MRVRGSRKAPGQFSFPARSGSARISALWQHERLMNTPRAPEKPPGRGPILRQLTVIAAVSLTLRVWALVEQRGGNPLFVQAILDDGVYLELAREFADGAEPRAWYLAPLYAWVLGILGKIGGTGAISMLSASLLSLGCGVLTSVLVTATARICGGACARGSTGARTGMSAGWIAGLLHACAGTFVFAEILPGQEPILTTLHAAALLLAVIWWRTRAGWAATAFGAVAGIAVLGRGTSLLLLPAALPLILRLAPESLDETRRGVRAALPGVGLALAGVAAVLLPAALRNDDVTGDFTPLPWAFGSNLYASNGPEARARGNFQSSEVGSDPRKQQVNAPRIAERALGRQLRPSEVSAYWRGRTLDEAGSAGEMAAHLWLKTTLFAADHDLASNHSPYVERRYATWLRIVPTSGWWLLAFGAFGWWMIRREHPEADMVAGLVVLTAGALIVLFPATRYRLPLLPLCAVVGAVGVVTLGTAPRGRRVVAGGLACVVGVLAFLPTWQDQLPNQHGASRGNLARRLLKGDRRDEGIEILREGAIEEPRHPRVLQLLALALNEDGQTREAAEIADRLNAVLEAGPTGRLKRLEELVEEGRESPAALAEAARVGPPLEAELFAPATRAHVAGLLAIAAARQGDRATAERHAERARALAPDAEFTARLDAALERELAASRRSE